VDIVPRSLPLLLNMMVARKIGSQNDTCSNLNCYTLFFMSKMDFIHTIDSVFFINSGLP